MTYAKLSTGSGIQWPCNEQFPDGKERLYDDGRFHTAADYCEIYGHDLMTGAAIDPLAYHAQNPNGKAKIKSAEYRPPVEEPDDGYPLWLTTGRLVYHWHTRTKTGRVEPLNDAAPDVFVQISSQDAVRYGLTEGDRIEIRSRRGALEARARIGDIAEGHLFVPFHYGYWDDDAETDDRGRAANELTLTGWDPVSKQPHFKFAAVRLKKVSS
jgi:anaerobic selenocysteine-containing dehydrogenase